MESIPYKTKTGATQYKPLLSQEEYSESDYAGFCLGCGTETSGVEPDARRYKCESCGAEKVYGLEELLMMGLLRFEE